MTGTAGNPLPVRPPLETLRLAFPQYRILTRVIGDRLFYLAEASGPGGAAPVRPGHHYDRLRDKRGAPVRQFTIQEPSIPRVWDALLGGKDNFAIDREQASQLLSVFPEAAELARESLEFQRRAVSHVASTGVRQFLARPWATSTTTKWSCRMRKACSPEPRDIQSPAASSTP